MKENYFAHTRSNDKLLPCVFLRSRAAGRRSSPRSGRCRCAAARPALGPPPSSCTGPPAGTITHLINQTAEERASRESHICGQRKRGLALGTHQCNNFVEQGITIPKKSTRKKNPADLCFVCACVCVCQWVGERVTRLCMFSDSPRTGPFQKHHGIECESDMRGPVTT